MTSHDSEGNIERMKITRRHLVWTGIGLVLTLLLVVAMRPEPAPVDLATVERGPLLVTLDQEGRTRVQERWTIAAPAAGVLRRIELEPGDQVAAGDVVATFEPAAAGLLDPRLRREAEAGRAAAAAEVERMRAERESAEARAVFAAAAARRARRMAEEGLLSAESLDAAETEERAATEARRASDAAVRQAAAALAAAEAALVEGAGDQQRTLEVRAPTAGLVLRRLRESAAPLAAGEPLLELGDLTQIEVMADYLSTDAVQIQAGMPVRIERWGGEHPLSGQVRLVEPSGFLKLSALGVEEQRVWVIADIESPPSERPGLGDGYRVETRVVLIDRPDVLRVPVGALVRDGESWSVYRVENDRAHATPVELGARSAFDAEVLGGLAAGDQVVLHPTDRVADGVKVEQRRL